MASQICPLCHQEAPSTARYCSNCAAPLGPEVTPPPIPEPVGMPPPSSVTTSPTRLDMAAWKSQRILMAFLAVAVIVLLACAIYYSHETSVLQAQRSVVPAAPPVLDAPTASLPAAPAVIGGQQKPLPNGSPVVGADEKPGVSLPPDVQDYLSFLDKIEDQRVALKNNVNGALVMLGAAKDMQGASSDTSQQGARSQINSGYSDYTQQWQSLMSDFQTKQPPDSCETLANSYYRLLQDYSAYISQVQVAMQNKDMSTLLSLQGKAQAQVNTDAETADDDLTALCQKYSSQKPFNIQSDSADAGTSVFGP